MPDVQHQSAAHRFTAAVQGGTAELEYQLADGVMVFTHTFVPEGARGQGVGESLVEAGLSHARDEGLQIVPQCPYVKHYVEEHPEAQDLLAR